jgi:hypothetical protein
MRLRIADCSFQEQQLLYVVLSIGPFPVTFGAIVWGDDGEAIARRIRLLAEQKALTYDAVDKNGLSSSGLCEIRDLKFEKTSTDPIMIKITGRLVHPFI